MNRITDAIAASKVKLSLMSESLLVELNCKFDLAADEFKLFQAMICQATEKTLNAEESCQVLSYLGQSQDGFNKQPLEVKIVLLKVFMAQHSKVPQT